MLGEQDIKLEESAYVIPAASWVNRSPLREAGRHFVPVLLPLKSSCECMGGRGVIGVNGCSRSAR